MFNFIIPKSYDKGLFDEYAFKKLAIDLSNQSIANLRRDLDKLNTE